MSILIKRYANRKLYNTQSSRYITLKGIATLLEQGDEVRVIDNETGEDITSVALSQILVDSERANTSTGGDPLSSLLTQIMERGGDVLYDVIKKGVGEGGGIDIQDRIRRIIQAADRSGTRADTNSASDGPTNGSNGDAGQRPRDRGSLSDWIAYAAPDFDAVVQNSIERVFKLLDLPRRKDVRALNHNLERVAQAVESLERALSDPKQDTAQRGSEAHHDARANPPAADSDSAPR